MIGTAAAPFAAAACGAAVACGAGVAVFLVVCGGLVGAAAGDSCV